MSDLRQFALSRLPTLVSVGGVAVALSLSFPSRRRHSYNRLLFPRLNRRSVRFVSYPAIEWLWNGRLTHRHRPRALTIPIVAVLRSAFPPLRFDHPPDLPLDFRSVSDFEAFAEV